VIQHRQDQVILALEVVVERLLADADFLEDPIQPDGMKTAATDSSKAVSISRCLVLLIGLTPPMVAVANDRTPSGSFPPG